jgi:hypothetical protein
MFDFSEQSFIQFSVTNGVNTNRVFDPNPPSGMVLVPAGTFTMLPVIWATQAIIQFSTTVSNPKPARWIILRRMGMAFTTWPGM